MIYHNVEIYLYTCLSTLTALYMVQFSLGIPRFGDFQYNIMSTIYCPLFLIRVTFWERDSFQGSSLLVGGPGLSQGSVIWHGGEKWVPELAVDEEDNKQHQKKEQQAHDYVGNQVRFVELALPEPSSPSAGSRSQKTGHAHRAAVGGVQWGGAVRGGLGHERQVEVWAVGGVQDDLPQHGTPRNYRLR